MNMDTDIDNRTKEELRQDAKINWRLIKRFESEIATLKKIIDQSVEAFCKAKAQPNKVDAVYRNLLQQEHNTNWLTVDERIAKDMEICFLEETLDAYKKADWPERKES